MRGHQQSNTRKLNRHWQSGGGRLIASFYMHAHYPNSAPNPGTLNSNILINAPVTGVVQNINIDRSQRQNNYQEYIQFISDNKFNRLFSQWYSLGAALGYRDPDIQGNPTPIVHSTYYGHDEYAYCMNIYRNISRYKMINLYVGAFYGVTNPQDNKIYSYFTYEDTRFTAYGPIHIPDPNIPSGVMGYSAAEWPKTAEYVNKLHIWIPCPNYLTTLLNPSTKTATMPLRDSSGQIISQVTTNDFPGVFRIYGDPGSTTCYKEYMDLNPLRPHIHLPTTFDITTLCGMVPYVREYNPDYHNYTAAQMMGDYAKKIFIGGPFGSGTLPASTSTWYNKTFRTWMPIGECVIHLDIDTTKTVEENMMEYAKHI